MANININGKEYNGNNIQIIGDKIIVDGKSVNETNESTLIIELKGGRIDSLITDKDIHADTCGINEVKAGGSVQCDDVHGDINCGGSVQCDDVAGNIHCGGSVNCDDVGGSVYGS